MAQLFLASQSPRRRDLLNQLGVQFECVDAGIDESILVDEKPQDYVLRLAIAKAYAGREKLPSEWIDIAVLGADTCVVVDGLILGKPNCEKHAVEMLLQLAGRQHWVFTGVALNLNDQMRSIYCATKVYFSQPSLAQIEDYVASGEPMDKAGAYAIQGLGGKFITQIEGSYSSVVGLPLYETNQLLDDCNLVK